VRARERQHRVGVLQRRAHTYDYAPDVRQLLAESRSVDNQE
jgi:hypothetical protein